MIKVKDGNWTCKDYNINVALSINNINHHLKIVAHKEKEIVNDWRCNDCNRMMEANQQTVIEHINDATHKHQKILWFKKKATIQIS